MTEQQDAQRRHFQQVAEDEGSQIPVDAGDSALADDTDDRPGRAPVSRQAGEASPTGTVGQREYAPGEGSASTG